MEGDVVDTKPRDATTSLYRPRMKTYNGVTDKVFSAASTVPRYT